MFGPKIILTSVIYCLISLLFVQLAFAESSLQAKDIPRISAADAQQMQSHEEVIFIDTRRPEQWQQATDKIKGAIRITTYNDLYALQKAIPLDRAIVAYCT